MSKGINKVYAIGQDFDHGMMGKRGTPWTEYTIAMFDCHLKNNIK